MPTLADFKSYTDFERRRRFDDAGAKAIRAEFQRAALDMAQVTGIPEWDLLGTYLNGWIERLTADNASLRKQLEAESTVDPLEIARLRQAVIGNNIRIEMIRTIMEFPRTVMQRAQEEQTDGR